MLTITNVLRVPARTKTIMITVVLRVAIQKKLRNTMVLRVATKQKAYEYCGRARHDSTKHYDYCFARRDSNRDEDYNGFAYQGKKKTYRY